MNNSSQHIPSTNYTGLLHDYPAFPSHPSASLSTTISVPTSKKPTKRTPKPVSLQSANATLTPRKRPGSDDETERKRGRPCLDTPALTKAETRKTQIRVAQRAYRGRKEETITNLTRENEVLRERNRVLRGIVEELYKGARRAGILDLKSEFGDLLRKSEMRLLELEIGEDEVVRDDGGRNEGPQTKVEVQSPLIADANPPVMIRLQERGEGCQIATGQSLHPQIYDIDTLNDGGLSLNDIGYIGANHSTHSSQDAEFRSHSSVSDENNQTNVCLNIQKQHIIQPSQNSLFPHLQIFHQLPSPLSYAYTETSFARRLTRTCLERATILLAQEALHPMKFNSVFAFCLKFNSRAQIHARLQACLDKDASESMYAWQQPFTHAGGAGTFYPNYDTTTTQLMPAVFTGMSMGPWDSKVMSVRDEMKSNLHLNMPGFQGHLFDPNDVESYLYSKGIDLTSNPASVTVDVNQLSLGDELSDVTTSDAASPRTPGYNTEHSQMRPGAWDGNMDYNPDRINLMEDDSFYMVKVNEQPMYFSSSDGMLIPMPIPKTLDDDLGTPPLRDQYSRRAITLDIGVLIGELLAGAVCLGRSPAFKPALIDLALRRTIHLSSIT